MRALTISAHGGLEQLQLRSDLPMSEINAPDQIRVRVRAAALNHLDLFVLHGLPGATLRPPWIMGADACGDIDAVGDGVSGWSIGERVVINPGISDRTCAYCNAGEHSLCVKYKLLGEHLPGTIAEYIVVPVTNVRRVAPTLDPTAGAAFSLATLTAWRMVVTRAKVARGERVLIWGIGGGVATAALQICKMIGADAWVTSSSDEKLENARRLGADHTLNHRTQDVAAVVRAETGKAGVDVVIDNVGHETWPQSLRVLGKGGRLVTCGATSGPMVDTDVRRLFWNQWTIMGSTMGNDREYDAIVSELRAGRLMPVVDSVWPMGKSVDAFARLESGKQFGKVVISLA